jgi:hypothetical protein
VCHFFRPSEEFFDHLNVDLLKKKFTHLSISYLKEDLSNPLLTTEIDLSALPPDSQLIVGRLRELRSEHRRAYWAMSAGRREDRLQEPLLRRRLPANFIKIVELFCDTLWVDFVDLYDEFEMAEAFCFRRKVGYVNWNVGYRSLRPDMPSL